MQDDASKRWDDSLISLGLGALVVVVSGILIFNYFSGQAPNLLKQTQLSSSSPVASSEIAQAPTATQSATQAQPSGVPTLPTQHTVEAGDSFWKIAEKYYGTGFEWRRIAEANKLTASSGLKTGMKLEIPRAELISATSTEKSPAPTQVAQAPTTPAPTKVAMVTTNPTAAPSAVAVAQSTVKPTTAPTNVAQATPNGTPAFVGQNGSNQPQVNQQAPSGGTHTYTVVKGDSLWKIAGSVCGNSYQWTSIARQNNLANPSIIHSGNTFTFTCS